MKTTDDIIHAAPTARTLLSSEGARVTVASFAAEATDDDIVNIRPKNLIFDRKVSERRSLLDTRSTSLSLVHVDRI